MVKHAEVSVQSQRRNQFLDITSEVAEAVHRSGVANGTCTVCSLHTTAGITVNENADPNVVSDMLGKLSQLVPQDPSFSHSEGNSDSHIKTSLMGLSTTVPVKNGSLVLGTWQSVYFCEFDGPRSRRVSVSVVGE